MSYKNIEASNSTLRTPSYTALEVSNYLCNMELAS